MSEKRFKLDFDSHSQGAIMDRQDKYGQYCRLYDFGKVGRQQIVDLLNEQQELIKEKSNVIILMGAFIKSKGFSIDDFDEWISKDWHNANEIYEEHYKEHWDNE